MTDSLLVEHGAGVTTLTLNRPARRNAIDSALYRALTAALRAADADPGCRVVLLTGAGGYFTAGNDLGDFIGYERDGEFVPRDFVAALVGCGKPVVAAVERGAIGIGTTLLLHCDFVYAGRATRFSLPFINFGLCPEGGSSLLLAAGAGAKRAARWLLLGEPFDAAAALDAGLVTEVLDDDSTLAAARATADRLAALPAEALRRSKALLRAAQPALAETVAREFDAFTDLLAGAEAQAALRAFVARANARTKP